MDGLSQQILDGIPDAILLVDARGTIVHASRAVQELFGYPPGELVGETVEILVPEADRSSHPGLRERYQQQPYARPMRQPGLRTAGRRRDGTCIPLDIKLSPLTVEGKAYSLAVVRDATERTSYEDELRRVSRQKDTFMGVLAHDLRSPLTIVRGYADLILGGRLGPVSPDQGEVMEYVREAVEMMRGMVDDLLDLSMIEQGVLTLRLAPTDIQALVEAGVRNHRLLAQARHQTLSYTNRIGPCNLLIDPNKISQVLDNLLTNAAKYSPDNSEIEVILEAEGSEVVLSVKDGGPGIPADQRERLFEPYTTAGARPYAGKSLGLGLSIVRKIVVGHRGRVWLADEGPGATFRVALPSA